MILETLVVGPLGVNCYLVGDEKTREAIVIDPGGDARAILDTLRHGRLTPIAIVATHAHFDHLLALEEVRQQTRAPFFLHADEAPVLANASIGARLFGFVFGQPAPADRLLRAGDEVRAGSLAFKVLHTPGHSPGGMCLWRDNHVFVGDTLFQGGIGRTDLPGGDYATLMRSIRDKLLTLPDDTRVYPGHGDATTIGEERHRNPFLRPLETGQWNV
ncbi:MAG: MBL fold metallo-hydrolase [Chloroflexi bacterium]|nr:MBL fold metallo-hydrolase [Chloroflexota bacterium]